MSLRSSDSRSRSLGAAPLDGTGAGASRRRRRGPRRPIDLVGHVGVGRHRRVALAHGDAAEG